MTLTNFWWLLIWLFTGGILIAFFSPKEKIVINGRIKERNRYTYRLCYWPFRIFFGLVLEQTAMEIHMLIVLCFVPPPLVFQK